MYKKSLCVQCAFRLNLESNKDVMVMSINYDKFEIKCESCKTKIGHAKHLNELMGVCHKTWHDSRKNMKIGKINKKMAQDYLLGT